MASDGPWSVLADEGPLRNALVDAGEREECVGGTHWLTMDRDWGQFSVANAGDDEAISREGAKT